MHMMWGVLERCFSFSFPSYQNWYQERGRPGSFPRYIYISYSVFQTSPSDAITIQGPLPQQGIAFRPKLRNTSSHAPPVPARRRRKRLFGIYRPVTLFIVICDRLHIRRRGFARRRDSSERAGLGREVSTRKLSAE